ncbi:Histone deacetylase 8 [Coemansia aciculifera]|uniref:Histone deacetylase 8 n=1 Tax=Coemansia aciculifera TaxID=417176 RepID=A0ACC1LYS3_9FUNG|nr:Histone deacetylase 8 [Coemansia aciculifera]
MSVAHHTVLVRSARVIQAADALPSNVGRASLVHGLIEAFGLSKVVKIVEPRAAADAELAEFHSEEYIDCLLHPEKASLESDSGSNDSDDSDDSGGDPDHRLDRFGLLYDCAVFGGMEEHVRMAAGGTLTAAECLLSGNTLVAMHWEGGRHHGQRSRAAGFCYVNDVVLGILRLQAQFPRVLYIDLDLHHGDGVQDAFVFSSSVMTLSIHHHDRGFYPNSGGACDEGRGSGVGRSINAMLRRGASDAMFTRVFEAAAQAALDEFRPHAVVVQCGCDGLAGDPHKVFNLTGQALVDAVRTVVAWKLPTLLLGGGGYNHGNAARCWARLTAVAAGEPDIEGSRDIPEHTFLNAYAPSFDMAIDATLAADENTDESIRALIKAVREAIKKSK